MKPKLRKTTENSYLWPVFTLFLPHLLYLNNGCVQPFQILQADFVVILEENETKTKKNEGRLVPVACIHPISTTLVVT